MKFAKLEIRAAMTTKSNVLRDLVWGNEVCLGEGSVHDPNYYIRYWNTSHLDLHGIDPIGMPMPLEECTGEFEAHRGEA